MRLLDMLEVPAVVHSRLLLGVVLRAGDGGVELVRRLLVVAVDLDVALPVADGALLQVERVDPVVDLLDLTSAASSAAGRVGWGGGSCGARVWGFCSRPPA